jgi:hypothetical protein
MHMQPDCRKTGTRAACCLKYGKSLTTSTVCLNTPRIDAFATANASHMFPRCFKAAESASAMTTDESIMSRYGICFTSIWAVFLYMCGGATGLWCTRTSRTRRNCKFGQFCSLGMEYCVYCNVCLGCLQKPRHMPARLPEDGHLLHTSGPRKVMPSHSPHLTGCSRCEDDAAPISSLHRMLRV